MRHGQLKNLATLLLAAGVFTGTGCDSIIPSKASPGGTPVAHVAPTLSFANGYSYSFGGIAVGATALARLVVSYSGSDVAGAVKAATVSAPFTFAGGSYPGTGGSCGKSISQNCTVVVAYTPTDSSGTVTDSQSLTINYNNGNDVSFSTTLSGIGEAPATLSISNVDPYSYGTLGIGSATDKIFTITHGGTIHATNVSATALVAPYAFKGGTYPGTGGTCTASIGADCTIIVTYTPTAAVVSTSALILSYSDGVTTQTATRNLTATGATPALLAISDAATYNFGNVALAATTATKTFTITNSGGMSASSVVTSGLGAPYTAIGGTCTATITVGTCTIIVQFSPLTAGTFNATMTLAYNNGVANQSASRPLTGVGVPSAILTLSDGPVTFAYGTQAVGSATDKTFTVTYTGGIAATIVSETTLAAPYAFKGGIYPGTGGSCGATISSPCTLVVTYSPVGIGVTAGIVTLSYNDGAVMQSSTRALSGTGATPATLAFNPGTTYNFGAAVAVGSSNNQTLNVTYGGGVPATAVNATGLSGPYSFTGGTYPGTGGTCAAVISANCTVVVTYAPTATGTISNTLSLSFNNGVTAGQTATQVVTGTGAAPAILSISDGATYDYGMHATTSTTDKTLTVSYSGGIAATLVTDSGLAAPFAFKGGTYPGTGGTCAATISATCTIVVTYTPVAAIVSNGNLVLTYNDGLTAAQTTSRSLAGTGAAPATLLISDAAIYDYGTFALGSPNDHTFTVTYAGGVNATGLSETTLAAPFAFKGGTFPGTGGTCAATISATCTVVVTYTPTAAVLSNGTLTLSFNSGVAANTATRALSGTGAAPAVLTISDGVTYNYGTLATGTSTDKTFTITYSGGVSATTMGGSGLTAPFTFKGGSYPGTGGTCTATLGAGTCTVVVNYSPTATGGLNQTLAVSYNDGTTTQSATRAVTGTGAAPATLAISDGATYDYGTQALTSAIDKTFTVTYNGGVNATAVSETTLAAPMAFKGGAFPGTGGSCAGTISATCTIVVTYTPTLAAVSNKIITLSYNDGALPQTATRAVTGTGAAAATLLVSGGPTYNFGTLAIGSSTDKTLTVTYGGGVSAGSVVATGLSAPYSFKGGTYPGTGGTCSATISATCTVVVTYAPTAAGTISNTLTLTFNDGVTANQASTREVTATAASVAVLTISDATTFDYGTHATTSATDKTLTVSFSGGTSATAVVATGLAAPFAFKDGIYPGTGGTCGGTIAANCTLVVTYTPAAAVVSNGNLVITYNDGLTFSQNTSRSLSGTGAAPATLAISDGVTYDYGTKSLNSTTDKIFTITYGGGISATGVSETTLAAPFSFKGGSFPGTGGTCSATISATCTLVVTYTPTVTVLSNGTITLSFNNGVASGQISTRGITGTGNSPAVLSISDGVTYNYGTFATGTSTDKTFTVTFSGGVSATAMSGFGLTAPFTFKGGTYPGTGGNCGATLGGATCVVVVNYSPTATGALTQTLSLSYNDGTTTQTATRAVTGTGATPASLSISDSTIFDYGTQATTSSTDKTFTITYSGGVSATAVSETTLAAPMAFKGGVFPGTGGTCPVAPATISSNCTVVVTYTPVALGASNRTITLAYNDGAGPQTATRGVTGTGAAASTLTISDALTYNYTTHSTGSSTDHTFTVTYGGGVSATSLVGSGLTSPYNFKGGTYPGTGGTCGLTISATCTVVVTYAPTVAGPANQTLTLTFNNGITTTTTTRDLTGIGASPATLVISDAGTYDFGIKATTSVNDKIFTVSYSGGVSATAVTPAAFTGVFTYKGGTFPGTGGTCPAAPATISGNCTIVVTFTPTSETAFSDSILLSYNDGTTSQSASRGITGTGGTPASLTISDGATYNYGTVTITSSSDKTFTVTNTGQAAATSISEITMLAPYAFKDGTFPGTGGNCGTSLSGSSNTCRMVVSFTPAASAPYNNTMTLSYSTGVGPPTTASRDLTGLGATVTQVAAGGNHSCILLDSGNVKCWGLNSSGQLGDGTTVSKTSPTMVTGISTATQISAGAAHTCARLSNSTIKCWGSGSAGQLGDDVTLANKTTPVLVSGLTTATSVSAGGSHSCAVLASNTIYCWGSNSNGQLGDTTNVSRPTPVAVHPLASFTQVSAGTNHTCARRTDSSVNCWGANTSGQIGTGDRTDQWIPFAILDAPVATTTTAVFAAGAHSCALLFDKSIKCWGSDQFGQLGDDAIFKDQLTPKAVSGITTATAISGGDAHSCARLSNNSLACWGANASGQIGNATTTDQPIQDAVTGVTKATSISSGGSHSCTVMTSGTVSCWGEDGSGELGDQNTGTSSDVPVSVINL